MQHELNAETAISLVLVCVCVFQERQHRPQPFRKFEGQRRCELVFVSLCISLPRNVIYLMYTLSVLVLFTYDFLHKLSACVCVSVCMHVFVCVCACACVCVCVFICVCYSFDESCLMQKIEALVVASWHFPEIICSSCVKITRAVCVFFKFLP